MYFEDRYRHCRQLLGETYESEEDHAESFEHSSSSDDSSFEEGWESEDESPYSDGGDDNEQPACDYDENSLISARCVWH